MATVAKYVRPAATVLIVVYVNIYDGLGDDLPYKAMGIYIAILFIGHSPNALDCAVHKALSANRCHSLRTGFFARCLHLKIIMFCKNFLAL